MRPERFGQVVAVGLAARIGLVVADAIQRAIEHGDYASRRSVADPNAVAHTEGRQFRVD
jgi:hypothetical protein